MKKIAFAGLLSLLVLGGAALAQQAEEQKKGASRSDMMGGMMKGEQSGEGKMEGMGGMGGMMRMMKMMDQCAAMMESVVNRSGQPKEEQKK